MKDETENSARKPPQGGFFRIWQSGYYVRKRVFA